MGMRLSLGLGLGDFRKRSGINIAALFAAQPGRVGAYWGKSFSDNLAKNRQALGPELSPYANGFSSLSGISGIGASVALSGTELVITSTSNDGADRGELPIAGLVAGEQYLIEVRAYRGAHGTQQSIRTSTALTINTTAITDTSAPGRVIAIPTSAIAESGVLRLYSSDGSGAIGDKLHVTSISIRRIADWSKIVQFVDPFGTVPWLSVFQAGAGLGLVLDQSKGLVRGANTFNDSNVTFSGGSSRVSPGVYRIYSADGTYSLASGPGFATVSGRWYEVEFTVDSAASPSTGLQIESVENSSGSTIPATVGPKRSIVRAAATAIGIKRASGVTDIQISNVSIRELPGNHLVQPTAAARGELSARYNYLLGTEAFASSAWTKRGTATATDGQVDHEGLNRGALLTGIQNAPAGDVYFASYQSAVAPVGAAATPNLWVKRVSTAGTLRVIHPEGEPNGRTDVNLALLADGEWVNINAPHPAVTKVNPFVFVLGKAGLQFIAVGGPISVVVACPDIRLTADTVASLPTYQRVTGPADYDDAGFQPYWLTKTDDGVYADIDPAGATNAWVFGAVQKMSDAAAANLLEFGPSVYAANGSFALGAPESAGVAEIRLRARGSSATGAAAATAAAPSRSILSGSVNLQAPSISLSVNGTAPVVNNSAIGAAAFAAQRLYVGSRAQTSLFANARWFAPPMLMFMQSADPGLTAGQIAHIERQMAQAAGVTL